MSKEAVVTMKTPPVVSQDEWEAARQELLAEGEGVDPRS